MLSSQIFIEPQSTQGMKNYTGKFMERLGGKKHRNWLVRKSGNLSVGV